MSEFTIALNWYSLDQLLKFLDRSLSAAGQPTVLRLWVQTIAEEVFESAVGNGKSLGCRVEPESRLVFRIGGAESPIDLRHLPGLCARAGMKGILVSPGSDSCMVQWH